MFEEMVVSSPNPKKTNKPWTVVISMLFQVAFLSILILIPLIYTEALPKTMMATMLTRRRHRRRLLRPGSRSNRARQAAGALDGRRQNSCPKSFPRMSRLLRKRPNRT